MWDVQTITETGMLLGLGIYAVGILLSTISLFTKREWVHRLGQNIAWVGAFVVIGSAIYVWNVEPRL